MCYIESKMQEQYEAGEAECEDLMGRLNPPDDWQQPSWGRKERTENWRSYVSDDLKNNWLSLSGKMRLIIAANLDAIARNELWD